ncbi:DUF4232 domain-containing protein [Streptacidiphilus rugosus]|uniref:DUF4232 domain-containing protein n=1 Tax=Streptacidiphilus rugosus TaxID=405783 RepID=UPI000559E156|nr:DUF4232 domain-containing protein [Streptacidiphilus rugosus]
MSLRTTLSSAAVVLLGSLALTACQPGATGASGASTPSQQGSVASGATGGAAPVSAPSTAKGSSSTGSTGASTGTSTGAGSTAGNAGGAAGGSDANSDSYAYTHPCSGRQVSVQVTRRDGAPGQRVIAVRNVSTHACGLSYFPQVYLDDSQASGGRIVKPLIPSGLGGAPAYPVHAGQTAYAVIDLNPGGSSTGGVSGIDELNVLADGDHMPNAETKNFPLGAGAVVHGPKLGLYRSDVADAVSSMIGADTQS